MTRAAVGLGSNRGDRAAHLALARERLAGLLEGLACSGVYETEPVGEAGTRRYLNMCCVGRTHLDPSGLLVRLQQVEREAGRPAPGAPGRSGGRTLDLDLLLYGERQIEAPELTVPHPRLVERPFVLVPLAEVAAGWTVAGAGATVGGLADQAERSGLERLGPLEDLTGEGSDDT